MSGSRSRDRPTRSPMPTPWARKEVGDRVGARLQFRVGQRRRTATDRDPSRRLVALALEMLVHPQAGFEPGGRRLQRSQFHPCRGIQQGQRGHGQSVVFHRRPEHGLHRLQPAQDGRGFEAVAVVLAFQPEAAVALLGDVEEQFESIVAAGIAGQFDLQSGETGRIQVRRLLEVEHHADQAACARDRGRSEGA